MKTEWQIIDFNNYEDKLMKLVSFGDDLEQMIKVSYFLIIKLLIEWWQRSEQLFWKSRSQDLRQYSNYDQVSPGELNFYRNIHIRFEDTYFAKYPYSFGFTLKELSAKTWDDNWQYKFFDRAAKENMDKPIFKLLMIEKFAFYFNYFTNEDPHLLASEEWGDDDDLQSFMALLFPKESSHIEGYDYIIEPICLVGKLRQLPKILTEDDSKINFNIEVDKFSVKLHKQQYDTICRLAEVAADYSKFQTL
jgi:hypothetical protein